MLTAKSKGCNSWVQFEGKNRISMFNLWSASTTISFLWAEKLSIRIKPLLPWGIDSENGLMIEFTYFIIIFESFHEVVFSV